MPPAGMLQIALIISTGALDGLGVEFRASGHVDRFRSNLGGSVRLDYALRRPERFAITACVKLSATDKGEGGSSNR